MASRPRCRDWTALITQQLRLRNLIQISGHNIVCAPKTTVYYTLHPTTMSAPFYTSVPSATPSNAIWPEINCAEFLTATALSVCIRVWQRDASGTTKPTRDNGGEMTAAAAATTSSDNDTLLFLWVVCFSGLVPISKRTDVRLHDNSLVFHIHGGFFTSAACLQRCSVLEQLHSLSGQRRFAAAERAVEAISRGPSGGRQHQHQAKKTAVINDNEPSVEANPDSLKLRYIERQFYASEVRTSYSVDKLQLLQLKQRQLKKSTAATQAIRDEICARSAFCMDRPAGEATTTGKTIPATTMRTNGTANTAGVRHTLPAATPTAAATTRFSSSASTPLTLSRLLNQQPEPPRPEVLWRAQQVRRSLETARFRAELLRHERGEALARTAQLQRRLAGLNDANIEKESWLLSNYHELRRERERADEMRDAVREQVVRVRCMREAVQRRQHQLLRELGEVFAIEARTDCGGGDVYAINGAVLPNSEAFGEHTSASAMSVALGWAAHLTVMCAVVLDVPLRNELRLRGSATRIRDDVKELQEGDREFPLFCRSCPPPLATRYACFLLNQNIGQLLVWLGHTTIDCRETLLNLLTLMNSPIRRRQAAEFGFDLLHRLPAPSAGLVDASSPGKLARLLSAVDGLAIDSVDCETKGGDGDETEVKAVRKIGELQDVGGRNGERV